MIANFEEKRQRIFHEIQELKNLNQRRFNQLINLAVENNLRVVIDLEIDETQINIEKLQKKMRTLIKENQK